MAATERPTDTTTVLRPRPVDQRAAEFPSAERYGRGRGNGNGGSLLSSARGGDPQSIGELLQQYHNYLMLLAISPDAVLAAVPAE